MSESEFKKIRLHLRLLTFCVVILIALLIANLVHRNFSPKSTSFPKIQVVQGPPGKDATIDYNVIDQYIQSQIAAIPKPQNGTNGQNGANGQSIVGPQGMPGISIQGLSGTPGASGPQGSPGKDGQNGIDGLILQVQVDPVTCQLQSKYTVSDAWITLAQLPKPCEP